MKNIPPILVVKALKYFFQGRVHFDRSIIGKIIQEDDEYEVFRKITLDIKDNQPKKPGAIFRVTFNFAKMNVRTNKILSLIPIPLIIAQEGFRSKTWMYGRKTDKFQGYYEWDTVEAAQNYWDSTPMKLMIRRSIPESLQHEIIEFDKKVSA